MINKKTVDSVIAEADAVLQVWSEHPKFSLGDLTLEQLKAEIDKLRDLKQLRDEMRIKLSKLVDNTNDQKKAVDSFAKRGRSSMKGFFGPDSAEYAQVGGK